MEKNRAGVYEKEEPIRRMKTLRVLEAISAILASILGLVPLAVIVFFVAVLRPREQSCQPIYQGGPVNCAYVPGSTALERDGVSAALPLLICAVVILGVGIAGVWHSRKSASGAWILLWLCVVILAFITFTNLDGGIGTYLLPSIVCAALACAFSLGIRRPEPVWSARPPA